MHVPFPVELWIAIVPASASTRSAKRLASAGYVERARRTDDERSVEISLTQAGVELRERVGKIPQVIVDAYDLDAEDFAALRKTLRELTDSVSSSTDDSQRT